MLLRQVIVTFICINDYVLAEMEGYIVGGERVPIKDYPHAAFLDVMCSYRVPWICGASIINQHFTLTAAHCVVDCTSQGYIGVAVGNEHKERGIISSAHKFKTHEKYNDMTITFDIALVRLKTPFKFGPNVQRIILMKKPPHEEVAYVAGWGLINEVKQSTTSWLKHARLNVMSVKECEELLHRIPDGTICAGSKSGKEYAAGGDSGSGLVIRGYIQIGIVSYKQPHISTNIAVYTDVAYFYDWIVRSTKNMYCG